MPYIDDHEDRAAIDKIIKDNLWILSKKGRLNYFLFKLFTMWEMGYETARNFLGELECAKLELYRRKIADYEDKKIKENGDVE